MKAVTRYQINSGELFPTEKEAKDFIVNKACEDLNEVLKKVQFSDMKFRDLVTIIETLTGDYATLRKAQLYLNNLLGSPDELEEETKE